MAGWALGEVSLCIGAGGQDLAAFTPEGLGRGRLSLGVGGGKGRDQLPRRRETAEDGERVVSVLGHWAPVVSCLCTRGVCPAGLSGHVAGGRGGGRRWPRTSWVRVRRAPSLPVGLWPQDRVDSTLFHSGS